MNTVAQNRFENFDQVEAHMNTDVSAGFMIDRALNDHDMHRGHTDLLADDAPYAEVVGSRALLDPLLEQVRSVEREPTMSDDLMTIWMEVAGRYPLLSTEQVVILSKYVQAAADASDRIDPEQEDIDARLAALVENGKDAKEVMISSNLRLVISIANKYPLFENSSIDRIDLIQAGNIRLERAVDLFDWRKGFKFSTYATFWIREGVHQELNRNSNLIRIPDAHSSALRQARREGIDVSLLSPALQASSVYVSPISLDAIQFDDDGMPLVRQLADDAPGAEDLLDEQGLLNKLQLVFESLSEDDRHLLSLRNGLITGKNMSFREMGEYLGKSNEFARRRHAKALARAQILAREVQE